VTVVTAIQWLFSLFASLGIWTTPRENWLMPSCEDALHRPRRRLRPWLTVRLFMLWLSYIRGILAPYQRAFPDSNRKTETHLHCNLRYGDKTMICLNRGSWSDSKLNLAHATDSVMSKGWSAMRGRLSSDIDLEWEPQ
jgi:hypothetical protein